MTELQELQLRQGAPNERSPHGRIGHVATGRGIDEG